MKLRLGFYLFFVLLSHKQSVAQESVDFHQDLYVNYKIGFLLEHRSTMAHLAKSHFQITELGYNFTRNKSHTSHIIHKNPALGLVAVGIFNSNQEVIGNTYGIAGRLTLPKLRWGKHWSLNNMISIGLAYQEKKFDLLTNPTNVAIGSHINMLIMLGTVVKYENKHWNFTAGLDFTHVSNGGTKKPNLGLNLPSLQFGFGYRIKKAEDFLYDPFPMIRRKELLIQGIFSLNNNYVQQKELFPVFGISVLRTRPINMKHRYLYGLDFSFNEANRNYLASSPDQTFFETALIGAFNAWELQVDRIVLSLGMGVYLLNLKNPNGWIYHRIGGHFEFSERVYFLAFARTHWAKADYLEVGFGYKFPRKQ